MKGLGMFGQPDRKVKVYAKRKNLTSKQVLRFDGLNVDSLANEFLPGTNEKRGGALSPRRQMEIFLRYVGGQSHQEEVAYDTGTHRTTVCKTLKTVLNKIVKRAKHWMKFPSTPEDIDDAKEEWSASGRMPGAIGAVDCMRIQIKTPARESNFMDADNNYAASLNVMATCDADARFTSIEANWPGTVHDADVWINSSARKIMSKLNARAWLLGDHDFDICPWLITPFGNSRMNGQQEQFNIKHQMDREVIRTAMRQLLARFPILDPVTSCIHLSLKKIPKLLVSCAVLHNMSKHLDDDFEFGNLSGWSKKGTPRDRFCPEDLVSHYRGVALRSDLLRNFYEDPW